MQDTVACSALVWSRRRGGDRDARRCSRLGGHQALCEELLPPLLPELLAATHVAKRLVPWGANNIALTDASRHSTLCAPCAILWGPFVCPCAQKPGQNHVHMFARQGVCPALSRTAACCAIPVLTWYQYSQKYTASESDSSIRRIRSSPSRSSMTSPPGSFCVRSQLRSCPSSYRSPVRERILVILGV